MRRRTRYIAIALGVIAALAVIGVLLLPTIAARALESKLTAALASNPDAASWESLDVGWRGELNVRALVLKDPERGVDVKAERVFVRPTLMSLFGDEPRIEEVRIEGASLALDAKLLRQILDGDSQDSEDPDKKDEPPQGMAAKLKKSLREHPPQIVLQDVALELAWGEERLFEFTAKQGNIEQDGEELDITVDGDAAIVWKKLPKLMHLARPWEVRARVGLFKKTVSATLTSGNEAAALVDLSFPRIGYVRLGAVSLDVEMTQQARHAVVRVDELDSKLGDVDELIAMVKAQSASMDLLEERPTLKGQGLTVEVTPRKLSEIQQLGKRLKPGALFKKRAEPEPTQSQGSDWQAIVAQLRSYGAKANAALMRADAQLEDATFAVHLELEPGKTRRIQLVSGLDIKLERGVIEASGASSGGDFSGSMVLVPGQILPVSATLVAQHVDIAKLPGMQQGRTLPNRGIRGRLSGIVDASFQWSGPTPMRREATLLSAINWSNGSLYLHGLAPGELEDLSLSVSGLLRYRPREGVIGVEEGKLAYNGLEATFEGSMLDWPLEPVLSAQVLMPETPCQEMVDALPDELLGPYRNVSISGEAAPELRVEYPLNRPHHLEVFLDGLAEQDNPEFRRKRRRSGQEPLSPLHKDYHCKVTGLKAVREGWPELTMAEQPGSFNQAKPKKRAPEWRNAASYGDVYWLNRPFIKQVPEEGLTKPDAQVLVGPGLESYVSLSALPIWVPGAAYLSEEILFYSNKGVSMGLVQKALRINLERGRFVYGGSTLTQQLVKNLFLSRDKTLARKLQEALISLRIDEVISKQRVIELYLNCIEFGPDLYGIGPAAQFYFQKHARELTPMEAVFLAIIKPSPAYGARMKRRGEVPDTGWIAKRVETIFKRMVEYKVITQEQADAERPYTLRWDEQGNYLPREKSAAQKLEELLENEIFGP